MNERKPPPREKLERDKGYGESHGYGPSHGGPSGPGDVPAKPTPPGSASHSTPKETDEDDDEEEEGDPKMSLISNATDRINDQTHNAKASLLDLATQALKLVNRFYAAEVRGLDTVLDRVGLQRRQSMLTPLAWFAAGAVVAGAAVVIATPVDGKTLRQRVARFIDNGVDTLAAEGKSVQHKVTSVLKNEAALREGLPNGSRPQSA